MNDPRGMRDIAYVETDIPAGITIHEWRAQRAANPWRGRARHSRRWLAALLARASQLDCRGREAQR
jgi:hypothetical protein